MTTGQEGSVDKRNLQPERALTAARFHALVRAVGTVPVSVTLPALRDAHVGPGTLERLWAAGLGLCHRNSSSLQAQLSVFFLLLLLLFSASFTHCTCCPRRCCPRSRRRHRTPSAGGCSGGWCIRTECPSRTCLPEDERGRELKTKPSKTI